MNKKHIIYALLWGLFAAGVWLTYHKFQPSLIYRICPSCDGIEYLKIQKNFDNINNNLSADIGIKKPFHQRILVPFIASFTNGAGLTGFQFTNGLFSVLTIIILYLTWKKSQFPPFLIGAGIIWTLFHWSGIVRYYHFDPVSVDVPVYFFHAIFLLIILSKKYWWIPVITPFAIATKESFLAYIVLFVIYALLHNRLYEKHFPMKPLWTAFALGLITSLSINWLVPASDLSSHNGFLSILYYTKIALTEPLHIVRWIIAIFTAFGAFFLLSLTSVRKHFTANPEQNLVLVFSVVSILFGLVAGMDRTRIMMIGSPFVLTSIFYLLRNRGLGVLITAAVLSIPVMRAAGPIPPLTDPGYTNWYPERADLWVVCAWGLYMIICYFILNKVDGYFERKKPLKSAEK